MDDLTPPFIKMLRELLFSLESGDGLTVAVPRALAGTDGSGPAAILEYWAQLRQNPGAQPQIPVKNAHHQIFCELLARGLAGQPVVISLKHLLAEAESTAQADLDRHISLLPFKALVPLLLFQFPAFLILLIGPLLRQLKNVALILVLIAGLSPAARGETVDQIYVRKLDSAQSVQDVEKVTKIYRSIQIERRACRLQLEERLLPKSCYKALHLEAKFGVKLAGPVQARTQARLDRRCLEAQRRNLEPEPGDVSYFSAKCRAEILKTRELARYREWPGS